jgi:prophage regulatory protein
MPPTNAKPEEQQDRFLRRAEVCRLTGLSVSSVYAMMAEGHFPKNVAISKRLVVWSEREVHSWMNTRIASRDSKSGSK